MALFDNENVNVDVLKKACVQLAAGRRFPDGTYPSDGGGPPTILWP